MDSLLLEAKKRSDQKAKYLRRVGRVPAVYYGAGKQTQVLEIDRNLFRKIFEKAGENTIIELSMDGKTEPVLVHEIQRDPLSDEVSHIDFIHVDMDKEVTTSVKVTCVGTSPAVKNMGGILDIQKHEIKIRCLPKDLIHGIEVDVTSIVDFHTSIHVKDLKLPATIKILDAMEDTVVTAVPPKAEEEEKPAEAAAAVSGAPTEAGQAAGAQPVAGTAPAQGAASTGKEAKK